MIYLCRHGQTEFNKMRRFQGQVDSPLTDLGQAQATAMGRRLAQLITGEFRIFASPLGRAQHSAKLISAALGGGEITLLPGLMEVGMGVWDGMTDTEIEATYPGLRKGVMQGEWWFHSPNGERFPSFSARIAAALAEVSTDPTPIKVVVAHGVVSQVVRGQHSNLSQSQTLQLPTPQDAFYALRAGSEVETIPC